MNRAADMLFIFYNCPPTVLHRVVVAAVFIFSFFGIDALSKVALAPLSSSALTGQKFFFPLLSLTHTKTVGPVSDLIGLV
jgi:hypothetical protein